MRQKKIISIECIVSSKVALQRETEGVYRVDYLTRAAQVGNSMSTD